MCDSLSSSSKVGDSPGLCGCRACKCLTSVLVCVRIAFSPHTLAEVCLRHVFLSEVKSMKKELRVFNKSLWRVNDNFVNAFHKVLLLTVD